MIRRAPRVAPAALVSPAGFVALGLGTGLSPFAPGTAGSLLALLVWPLIQPLGTPWIAALLLAALLIGIPACRVTGERLGMHDHPALVWDEIVGQTIVLALAPADWRWWLAALVLFRLFDILKPFPIRRIDRHVQGGLGVMLDDVLAAVYAVVVLLGLVYLL